VDDVVEAYARLLDPRTAPGVYNVASGTGVALRSVLEALLRRARVQPELEVDPARVRPADALVGDAARLARATGWAPRRPLDDTLARLLDDWRARITGPP
jgi:GDP-4-dehydro-6-deoxy-D-mannose reductase